MIEKKLADQEGGRLASQKNHFISPNLGSLYIEEGMGKDPLWCTPWLSGAIAIILPRPYYNLCLCHHTFPFVSLFL